MLVSDIGPPDAKILLVGEAPGSEEERAGVPFIGHAGKLLKQMAAHSSIDYSKCYVTNVSNERPPGNDFTFFYSDKNRNEPNAKLTMLWAKLRHKIEEIKPNVVIALGAEALRAITGERKISQWRGTIMMYKGIKIIPTYHPAYVMRVYGDHPIVELDFSKALRESDYPEYREPKVDITIRPNFSQVISWLDKVENYKRISFDIETLTDKLIMRCISLSVKLECNTYSAISIPFIVLSKSSLTSISSDNKLVKLGKVSDSVSSYWSIEDEIVILTKLSKIFNSNIEVVGQNSISFDAPIIRDQLDIQIKNHYMDTMHAWHVLYSEFPKSLSFLCSVLTNHRNYWTNKNTGIDDSEWKYNCYDSIVTLEVSYVIEDYLREENLLDFYFKNTHRLAFALSDAQEYGILFDVEEQKHMIVVFEAAIDKVKKEINVLCGYEINPGSPKQVKKLLYSKLRFPTMHMKGKVTVDEVALRKLEKRYPNEIILSKIIGYRKVVKLVGTYLNVNIDEDSRMRTSYNASGTKGARISSSKTLRGTGLDLQNIPAGRSRGVVNIRHLFIAGKNKKLVKGDLSQAETRIVSEILYRCGDNTLHELYKNPNFDIHKWMATFIYGKIVDAIIKLERDVGKLANHSGNYGAGPNVLMAKALKDGIEGIDYNFAQLIMLARHRAIPGLKVWWSTVERQLRQTRILTTCLGRKRIFFGRLDDTTYRDAYSFEPQSTCGEVCNIIFTALREQFIERRLNNCHVILQNHDEVVVECLSYRVSLVAKMMKDAANIPLYINKEPLIIPIDISVGDNWRDMEEYEVK